MNGWGVGVFVVTYALISARRLRWLGFDRPAGALLGAVACVALGVLSPARALGAIDGPTLLLLFGVMGMGAFLSIDGLFDAFEHRLASRCRTPARLLGAIVWGSGLLAAFVTNDAVCVLGAPLVVRLIERHKLPPLPFLLALATAANTGSAATLVGNPQNMLCASLGGLSFSGYALRMAPVALVGLALNHALLYWMHRHQLRGSSLSPASSEGPGLGKRGAVTGAVILGTVVVYSFGADMAWTATGGFVLLMLLHRRDTSALWARIDWSVLLFFAGLFVVVEGFVQSQAPRLFFERFPLAATTGGPWGWGPLVGLFLVGSNVVSNVPFILVIQEQMATLPSPKLAWELLAMASTFAGNLTLLGSVANIIVAEVAREHGSIPFLGHLRVGLPVALATTAVGTLWMTALSALGLTP